MTRGGLLILAGAGGVGLYLWASGGLTTARTWFRDVMQGTPLPPPPPPEIPASLSWMQNRPENPEAFPFSPYPVGQP
jgi:hypothetical protein